MKTFLVLIFFWANSFLSAKEVDRLDNAPVTMSFFKGGIYEFALKNDWIAMSVKFIPSDNNENDVGLHFEFIKVKNRDKIKFVVEGLRDIEQIKSVTVYAGEKEGLNTVFHQMLLERSKIDGFSYKALPFSDYKKTFPD